MGLKKKHLFEFVYSIVGTSLQNNLKTFLVDSQEIVFGIRN